METTVVLQKNPKTYTEKCLNITVDAASWSQSSVLGTQDLYCIVN